MLVEGELFEAPRPLLPGLAQQVEILHFRRDLVMVLIRDGLVADRFVVFHRKVRQFVDPAGYQSIEATYRATRTFEAPRDAFIAGETLVYWRFATSIYDFGFSYDKPDGTVVITDLSWGPYTMTNNDILVNELWKVPITMFLNVGLLFYLIVLLTWWMERSRKRESWSSTRG